MCGLSESEYGRACFVRGARCFTAGACQHAAIMYTLRELRASGRVVSAQQLCIQEGAGDRVTTIRVFDLNNPEKYLNKGLVALFESGELMNFIPENLPVVGER